MSTEQTSNKAEKKQAVSTPKEKKGAGSKKPKKEKGS